MRFKTLETKAELEQFRDLFLTSYQERTKKAGSDLPLSYLSSVKVVGVLNREQKMVAGYVLGATIPLRLLEFVPEQARLNLVVPYGGQWSDCCEIASTWRLPEVSLLFMSASFWPHALIGVLKSGKRILLGGSQNVRLEKFYTALWPAILYSGPSTFGFPSKLFAYNRVRIIICILGLWVFETPRRFLRGGK